MLLADTSAWIAFQRGADSPASAAVRRAIDDDSIATTDLVVAEMLAGLAPDRVDRWTGLFALATYVPQLDWDDALAGAGIYRACRRGGFTPRSIVDCLIAAIAVRTDMAVVHEDRDYDAIATVTDLRVIRE